MVISGFVPYAFLIFLNRNQGEAVILELRGKASVNMGFKNA